MSGSESQADGDWWWCMSHAAVEHGAGCRGSDRLGPYPTAEAAEHWRERVEQRNDAWDEQDREWSG